MAKLDKAELDRAWEAVQAAVRKFNAGESQDEQCVFCHGRLIVIGLPGSWDVRCPCGKSNTTLKGL